MSVVAPGGAEAHAGGIAMTQQDVWRALRSVPAIDVYDEYVGSGYRFRVASHFRSLNFDVLPLGRARIVGGQRRWQHFSVVAMASGGGRFPIAFCYYSLSKLRTSYPYTNFLLTNVSDNAVWNGKVVGNRRGACKPEQAGFRRNGRPG
jgi:hypothetical protein